MGSLTLGLTGLEFTSLGSRFSVVLRVGIPLYSGCMRGPVGLAFGPGPAKLGSSDLKQVILMNCHPNCNPKP